MVRPDTLITEVADTLVHTGNLAVPVVDEQGEYLGLITAQKLAELAISSGTVAKRRHAEEIRGEELGGKEKQPREGRAAPELRKVEETREEYEEQPESRPRSVLEMGEGMRELEEPGSRPEAA